MSVRRISNYLALAIWVSICAATPEFMWQGLVVFVRHLTIRTAAAPLLIGTLFAFFVEPLVERVKGLRWRLDSQPVWPAYLSAPISIAFGFVAVCIHESVGAYVSHPGASPAFARAVTQLPEWSSVPFVVTIAWFGAFGGRWLARTSAALAGAAVVAIGIGYGWSVQEVITNAVPALVLVVAGQRQLARNGRPETIDRLARLTAIVALTCLALAWTAEFVLQLAGLDGRIYTLTEFGIDFRFYLGWSLGIVFAPNPMAGALPRTHNASS